MSILVEIVKRAQREKLPHLIVGGHAMILYQVPRFTRDLDFVIPEGAIERWLDFLQSLGFRVFHRTGAFIQLEQATAGSLPPIDLMLVDESTWNKLSAKAEMRAAGEDLLLPVPHVWHLIAMKLVAAKSPTRRATAVDWTDICNLIEICEVDLLNSEFQNMVIKFGGRESLDQLLKKSI